VSKRRLDTYAHGTKRQKVTDGCAGLPAAAEYVPPVRAAQATALGNKMTNEVFAFALVPQRFMNHVPFDAAHLLLVAQFV